MLLDIWIFFFVLLFAGLLGITIGYPLATMLCASLGIIAWNIFRINQLYRWLANPKKVPYPDTSGQFMRLYRLIDKRKSKHKKRKRKLAKNLKQFRKAFSVLPDAIVLVDHNGKINWASPNAKDIFGIESPRDNDAKFIDLIADPTVENLLIEFQNNPSSNSSKQRSIEYTSKRNSEISINIRITQYTKNLHMVIGRDVSQLLEINKIQSDFVANVSHELKTPLTVLKGYLDIIQNKDDLPPNLDKIIIQMQTQNDRMELIVNDLLYLAKLENQQQQSPHNTVDITTIVNTVIETIESKAKQKQLKLKLDIDDDLTVVGNRNELHNAFSNLIYNAVNYTPQGGIIQISWEKGADGMRFSVRDNGEGISNEHIPRLTQRFYRVDSDRSRDGGGSGLGLAIVKHVLQRHNAVLQIESEIDKGSEFTCVFPNIGGLISDQGNHA